VESLCRRLFLLRYFHGDGLREIFEGYSQAAAVSRLTDKRLIWHDHSRHSTRKDRDIPIGGLTGYLRYEGDFGLLAPLLRLGEYIHLGKNVIFGLGRITVKAGADV
jgi:hypothetical protein